MEPFVQTLLGYMSMIALSGGLIYFLRVRIFTMGTKKEILTALTVMGISAIVLLLLAIL